MSTFATFLPAFTTGFDEIRLVVTGLGSASLLVDNMTFSEISAQIPLPASGVLLIGALEVLRLSRGQRKS